MSEFATRDARYVSSPVQLTWVKDLSTTQNIDAIKLKDILCDPMIKECWQFNYLFHLDFLMSALDPDTRHLVQVRVVHGSWKREDSNRIELEELSAAYPNVKLITAYIPEAFGTHHSKMMILIRHDDTAQVIIHTANMIPRDWQNMTQAMWRSPLLPLQSLIPASTKEREPAAYPIGSGERFKVDLLYYLNAYGNRLSDLTKQLVNYDFSSVRAALITSTPSRQKIKGRKPSHQTSFGWLGLGEVLSTIPISPGDSASPSNIVMQISSIATLGQYPRWIQQFQSTLSKSATSSTARTPTTFFANREAKTSSPTFNIIFPTPSEIRVSLDGYNSGGSIHTKIQSAAQQKQLAYLRPLFCHWMNDTPNRRRAERNRAAPHIKTYIRFSDASREKIDWAMVTSANLSTQAWGALEKDGEVRVSSYEIGVVVWPELYKERDEEAVMVPVFGKDMPDDDDDDDDDDDEKSVSTRGESGTKQENAKKRAIVGFRMPYDLPLVPYQDNEDPWCATMVHEEPDWRGVVWK
ncbi:phospholipase D/nuclease [Delitschia confertaspora ATCC 74209]|uniref:Phospholipase D/nuclease n=1 Tax=Delitschia confertaspora ATCC 74209 TaxID=1513339 RepID=A0A9P4JLW8_9PLEO|nr:phospholipase D/nuclease [Delitschia confertaspora ATCC 74209]